MANVDPEIVRKVAEAVADHCEQKVILRDEVVRVALAVAEPLIREQVAQEIAAQVHHDDNSGGTHAPDCWRWHTDCALLHAAGIARGGQ